MWTLNAPAYKQLTPYGKKSGHAFSGVHRQPGGCGLRLICTPHLRMEARLGHHSNQVLGALISIFMDHFLTVR
jgi:hypothetical protein